MSVQRSPSVTIECEKCGVKFHPRKKNKPGRFCSRACAPRGRQPTNPDATCATCGVLYRASCIKRMNPGREHYCSRECYRKAPGRKCLNTQGYVTVYAPNHPDAYRSGQIQE